MPTPTNTNTTSSTTTTETATPLDTRLGLYVAAASTAALGAAANAQIIAQTDLGITIFQNESASLDFGPGFGEAFAFEVRTTAGGYSGSYASSFFQSTFALFQFDPNQTLWSAASFINVSSAGTYSYGNDPARLAFGAPISASQLFDGPMTSTFSTSHDLAGQFSFFSNFEGTYSGFGSYGGWAADARGYIGFRLAIATPTRGSVDYHYGWIDVETADNLGTLIIDGWGLNTTPNAPIFAGQIPAPGVGGLAMLAMGAAGIRRKRHTA